MEFRDLIELATRVAQYKSTLLDEQEIRTLSKGTYHKDPNYEVHVIELDFDVGKVNMTDVICMWYAQH